MALASVMLLALVIGCSQAWAAPGDAGLRTGAITFEKSPVEGLPVHVYRIADAGEDGVFVPVEALGTALEITGIDLATLSGDATASESMTAAQTLEGYVMAESASFDPSSLTVSDGPATLDDLTAGMYLVVCETTVRDGFTYIFNPFIITIPGRTEDGTVQYERIVELGKFSKTPSNVFTNTVTKSWVGDSPSTRPTSVSIDIYDGTAFYGRVELNEGNDWTYVWAGEGDWSVTEVQQGVSGYVQRTGYSVMQLDDGTRLDIMVTNSSKVPGKATSTVKTGDDASVLIPVMLIAAAAVLVIGAIVLRRRKGGGDSR